MAQNRIFRLANHLTQSSQYDDDDVVIVSSVRTPICKAKRGGFSTTTADILLSTVLKAVTSSVNVPLSAYGEICVGNVLQPGGGAMIARIAQFEAGIPETVPLSTVNRQCSSGLQAIAHVYHAIKAGTISAGIAAGVESMSFNSFNDVAPMFNMDALQSSDLARDCLIPMGDTSDTVATKYNITRVMQDTFAARSHTLAAKAQKLSEFSEIVPVETAEGNIVSADDGIRPETTLVGLSKLRPAFSDTGSATAGNSSQVSDGAAAVVLMRRSEARKYGIAPVACIKGFAVVGVPPAEMGIGPRFAIPAALADAKLKLKDIDVFEINEAFASQCLYSAIELGIRVEGINENSQLKGILNPLGGAIALGHPLGCTGARQTATLLHYLRRHNLQYGVVSMCIGTGMGAAMVFKSE